MARRKSKKRTRVKFDGKRWADRPSPGFEPTSIVFGDDVKLYEPPKKGTSKLSIVPYPAGEGNPNFEEGEGACERTYFVHRGIGAKKQSFVCLAETYGEKCPVCQERSKLFRGDPDDVEAAKALAPKVRQLWNVYDHDNPKEGVQVLDISYHLFGRVIREAIEDEEDFQSFADPDDGLILKVKWKESSFRGNNFTEVKRVDFAERNALPDKVLDKAIVLDDLVKKTEYDDLKSIFNEAPPVDDDDDEDEEDFEEEDTDEEEDEFDDDDFDDEEEEDEDEDDEEEEDFEDDDEDEDDDFDDEEEDEDEDEDDDDDFDDDFDDDDEPEPPKKRTRKKPVKKAAAKKPAKKAAKKRPAKKAAKKRGKRKR